MRPALLSSKTSKSDALCWAGCRTHTRRPAYTVLIILLCSSCFTCAALVTMKHERGSVNMLRFMLKDNMIDLSAYEPPLFAKDLTFIEEMILGTRQEERRGRGADKEFLYDIVNNTR